MRRMSPCPPAPPHPARPRRGAWHEPWLPYPELPHHGTLVCHRHGLASANTRGGYPSCPCRAWGRHQESCVVRQSSCAQAFLESSQEIADGSDQRSPLTLIAHLSSSTVTF